MFRIAICDDDEYFRIREKQLIAEYMKSKSYGSIPESSREEMFELTKREFLRENGVLNGDTTQRSEVYTNLYRKMKKEDRLAVGNTLENYERQYRQAFVDAVKSAVQDWELGKPVPRGALDDITRESVEKQNSNAVDIRI